MRNKAFVVVVVIVVVVIVVVVVVDAVVAVVIIVVVFVLFLKERFTILLQTFAERSIYPAQIHGLEIQLQMKGKHS